MRFTETPIRGAFLVDIEPASDERGFFARTFCPNEFADAGIDFCPMQTNLSRNTGRATLRGMHFQAPPFAEAKLVRVSRGAIYDVVVDLRVGGARPLPWFGAYLDEDTGRALYVPEGCAHGFLTLEDETDVEYMMSRLFEPGHDRGFRWNDPAARIDWPEAPQIISARDASWPDYGGADL